MTPGPPTLPPPLTHDVFVSYRRHEPDRSWVTQRLVPGLRSFGVRVFLDDDEIRLGEPLVLAMTRGVEQSRFTLAVLSPAYVESNFTELESLMAEHLGLEAGQRRLIAVMRQPVEARLSIRMRLWQDMSDAADFDVGLERIRTEVLRPWDH